MAALFCLLTCLAATWGNFQETAPTHLSPHIASAPHPAFSDAQQHAVPHGSSPVTFGAIDVDDSDEFSAHKLTPSSSPGLLMLLFAAANPEMPSRGRSPLTSESPLVCHIDLLRTTVLLI